MTKEEYIRLLETKLSNLDATLIKEEIEKINNYFERSKEKGVSEEDIIKSLGDVDDLVKTISINKNIKSSDPTIKANVISIYNNLKKDFLSKDKKIIISSLGYVLYTIFVAIVIKIPFLFVKTILLDYLNNINISYNIQSILSGIIEGIYIFAALIITYKYLKKYFSHR